MRTTTQAYFDCNATTPTLPEAAAAALDVMQEQFGNPSSSHLIGLQARHVLESARKVAARAIGADADEIVFTSGATEAIQTAIFSALRAVVAEAAAGSPKRNRILYGATEHKAVPQALHYWVTALGLSFEILEIPVDRDGILDLEFLERESPRAALVCTMAVNNETGVIQDLAAIEAILARRAPEALWMADSVQALGKLPLDFSKSRIHYAPFSGHKIYAPKGIGFLYVRKGAPFSPIMVGGGQEHGQRSGTENLPGVAAFGCVLSAIASSGGGADGGSPFHSHATLIEFRERIAKELERAFPRVVFNSPFERSVPTTLNFSVPGLSSKELLDLFDSAGLRLSAGSACSSAVAKPSHVLEAMGLESWRCVSALRLSFGPATSVEEIEAGCRAIREAASALQGSCLLETTGGFEAPGSLRDGVVQFRAGASNSWIVVDRDSRAAVIIDPCDGVAERIQNYARCQDLKIRAIVDTHSHADHVSVGSVLRKLLEENSADPRSRPIDGLGWIDDGFEVTLDDGSQAPAIRVGAGAGPGAGLGARVLARVPTPGHTADSSALVYGTADAQGRLSREAIRFAFCGDTVLSGGLGRTNFASSDCPALFGSLRKLDRVLTRSTLLCPAHDYGNSFATSLEAEVSANPLLARALSATGDSAAFVREKTEIDKRLGKIEEDFHGMVCGVAPMGASKDAEKVSLDWEELRALIADSGRPLEAIDVREPQEFNVYKDWGRLGLSKPPRNVPLSRFVNFIAEELSASSARPRLVLLCRSGNRSLQAVKSLRRLGIRDAWNLEGGVALG